MEEGGFHGIYENFILQGTVGDLPLFWSTGKSGVGAEGRKLRTPDKMASPRGTKRKPSARAATVDLSAPQVRAGLSSARRCTMIIF